MESMLAGAARCLFSATRAAAVTCGIMNPELRPGLGVRNAGSRDSAGSTSMAMRRSASEPISQMASAIMSEAKRDGLGVEIAAGKRDAVLGDDQRVVGDAVRLVCQHASHVAQSVEDGAHHLRLAAQTVGVLDAVVADAMRLADGAAGHEPAQGIGAVDLATMPAQRVDARIEGCVGAFGGFGGEHAGDQRGAEQGGGREQRGQRIGGGELRAVEERQAFLGTERQRREATLLQRLRGRLPALRRHHVAGADHGRSHVGERRQIAGGAHRALAGHDRDQTLGQHRFQQRDGCGLHAGSALREARDLEGHHEANDFQRRGLAHARGVREHDIGLQPRQVGGVDADAGKLSEAGVDAVHRLTVGNDGLNHAGARLHRRQPGGIEPRVCAPIDGPPVGSGSPRPVPA